MQMKLCFKFALVWLHVVPVMLVGKASRPRAQLMRTSSVDALESVVSLGPMLLGMLDTK